MSCFYSLFQRVVHSSYIVFSCDCGSCLDSHVASSLYRFFHWLQIVICGCDCDIMSQVKTANSTNVFSGFLLHFILCKPKLWFLSIPVVLHVVLKIQNNYFALFGYHYRKLYLHFKKSVCKLWVFVKPLTHQFRIWGRGY